MKDDTHPKIAKMILDGHRRMTPAEKLARCGDLSLTVRQLSAARREHAEADEREVRRRVAALLYPPELMPHAFGWVSEPVR